ncbi:MAG: hypothetical protein AABZ32_08085 [Bacteroidota bacterium]
MTLSIKQLQGSNFKEPMVLFSLRQYEALVEYLEDMEDRLAIKERANEDNISWEEIKKDIRKKRNNK